MIKAIVLFFLFFIPIFFFGQSQKLKGRIVADSLEGFAINIVNYTKKIGGTNSSAGYFEIESSPNDSIIFSSVQYEVISIKVKEEDLKNDSFTILLNPIVRKLDQIRISNVSLSGNIDKDAKGIQIKPFVTNKTLGLPFKEREPLTQVERRIYSARTGILDLPINYLNGKLKKLRKAKEIEDLNTVVKRGRQTFNTSFFVEALGIPRNLIDDFMYYCAEDTYFEGLLENTKRLPLLEFFEQKAISYKVSKGIN